jgi:hypothetical protein
LLLLLGTQQTFAQHREVFLRHGLPVIAFRADSSINTEALRISFGMSAEQYALLNPIDTAHASHQHTIFLTVQSFIADSCAAKHCVELYYLAQRGDHFQNLAPLFGKAHPRILKSLNPAYELELEGKPVFVGFMPLSLLSPILAHEELNKPTDVPHKIEPKQFPPVYTGTGTYASEFAGADTTMKEGKARYFKSMAGWYDGKFYILSSQFAIGTVVKVTNKKNQQMIFAKVIGELPVIKKEESILARLSSAACAALDVWDENDFDIIIQQ